MRDVATRGAFLAAGLAMAGSGASLAQTSGASDVVGVWTGRYICNQGVTAITLDIASAAIPDQNSRLTATFRFGPVRENPGVPVGAFTMSGEYDARTRQVVLRGQRWIDRPSGYEMVDLRGRLATSGDLISGSVPFEGCGRFQVTRREQPIA